MMKAEIHMQFKKGKASQKAHDLSSLIGLPFSMPGREKELEKLDITHHELAEG